jgi:hypothetical protein
MAGEVDFYQIYFHEGQKSLLFPFAKPYFNEKLTVFFENSVISQLVPASNAEKIAVCSYALRKKINNGIPMRGQELGKTKDEILAEALGADFDVLALTRRQNPIKGLEGHFMLAKMDNWHPGSRETLNLILKAIGIEPFENRREPKDPIYQNHFVARAEIYKEYVSSYLVPAMKVMENELRDRCYEDSQYYKLKTDPNYPKLIKDQLGMDYVPLHTFLLERLFSCWIHGRGFKINYL